MERKLRSRRSVGSETLTIAVTSSAAAAVPTPATTTTPAIPARIPPLLRKSSSTGLLDGVGNLPEIDKTKSSGGNAALPKLRRRASNPEDVVVKTDKTESSQPHHTSTKLKIKKSARAETKHASGWNTPPSTASSSAGGGSVGATPLPQLNTKTLKPQATLSTFSTGAQTKRSKRATDIALTREATIAVVVKYQLGQHELKKFKQCFRQIDLDASGVIDYDEFFEFIDETKTPFSEGLFRMIDSDSNGTIDYEEFVHAMVLYCMYTRDEILQFAFNTFDPFKMGAIGEKEFKRLISVVNDGQPVYPGNFKNALAEFDRNKDGRLDFEEFKIMNKRYPMLLFPCFRLQDRMQKSTLGESHWLQLHKRLFQKLKLENYQRKHNGALPALSLVGTIRKFFRLDALDVYEP